MSNWLPFCLRLRLGRSEAALYKSLLFARSQIAQKVRPVNR